MARCALCNAAFTSRQRLVQHFSEAHSVAKQRSRRHRREEDHGAEEVEGGAAVDVGGARVSCPRCGERFASLSGHQCGQQDKKAVVCQYCGQRCKDRRGAAIHQAFCANKYEQPANNNDHQAFHECSGEDCGAIFKTQKQLERHMHKHHREEAVVVLTDPWTDTTPKNVTSPQLSPPKSSQQPLVTVMMKPHIGKTDGLQDLSLLITKGMEEEEFVTSDAMEYSAPSDKVSPTITVEECRTIEASGGGEAVIYVTEDGTVINSVTKMDSKTELNKTINATDVHECHVCHQVFCDENDLTTHVSDVHSESLEGKFRIKKEEIMMEEEEEEDEETDNCANDEDWELISFRKRKKSNTDHKGQKRKYEYRCRLCRRNFLSELGYQSHVRNKECKNKKFKLTRMFSCHFKRCDSSFFKLTELQRHWQIAHKYSLATKNLTFNDEREFTQWLSQEEDKDKVRFTCDVRRKKAHRTERLLVCHRFHHLRTAAARKAANQEYSDKHNWIHKIEPCLCFARMKVYQEFDKDTCDYTGKITVVYYYEHAHPNAATQNEKSEIIDHILQRNKRNRKTQFQDLKGNEKVMHRQKLEKFARLAGKEYRNSIKSPKPLSNKRIKQECDDMAELCDEDQIAAANVANNLLGSDELFASQVEMVLDGQFDMGPEVLAGPVVSHLGGLTIFEGNAMARGDDTHEQGKVDSEVDWEEEGSTLQVVLPASKEDWSKLFNLARERVAAGTAGEVAKAEAALVLPYEKVIELIPPNDQIPIFRQLWELAYPANNSEEEEIEFEIRMVR